MLDVSKLGRQSQAGITAYAARLNHYDVVVDCDADGNKSVQAVVRIGQSRNVMASVPLKQDTVYLRIDSDTDFYNLSYSLDNKTYYPLARMEYRYLSTETIGGFCGVHLGVYVQTLADSPSGYVDVDWFDFDAQR